MESGKNLKVDDDGFNHDDGWGFIKISLVILMALLVLQSLISLFFYNVDSLEYSNDKLYLFLKTANTCEIDSIVDSNSFRKDGVILVSDIKNTIEYCSNINKGKSHIQIINEFKK